MLSYWQPGADDDARPGPPPLELDLVPSGACARSWRRLCTDAAGRHHAAGIPPPLIRPEVIAAFRAEARAMLPPQYIAVTEATPAPFFQPIFDLEFDARRGRPRGAVGRCRFRGAAACRRRRQQGRAECGMADRCAGGGARQYRRRAGGL